MALRDDHDAAITRADALERELEAERAKSAAHAKQLDAERAARIRLESLMQEKPAKRPPPPPPQHERKTLSGAAGSDLLEKIAVALYVVAFVLLAMCEHSYS